MKDSLKLPLALTAYGILSVAVMVLLMLLITGCAYNRPKLTETTTTTNGVVMKRELSIPTWAFWPATSTLEKQKASVGKTLSVGTGGLEQQTGGTNVVEALKAIDSILGKIHP